MTWLAQTTSLTVAALVAVSTPVAAQAIASGNYVYHGGNGSLSIKTDHSFAIATVGGNAHVCDLEGTIVGNRGKATDSACVLIFKPVGSNLQLVTNGDASCREFCGARAGFDGLYIKPTPACTANAIAATRKAFKSKYDGKDYASAAQTLAPVLSQCAQALNRFDENWIRNDLALAQLRSGDKAACLQTLEPLVEMASMSNEEIRETLEPAFVDALVSIAKATRTNLKLCKSGTS